MNLFILDLNPEKIAEYMFDKHLVKIILEAVQMLSTASRVLEPEKNHSAYLYKIAHLNHPVSIWVRESLDNYLWTIHLVEAMHNEWKFRYDVPKSKNHKSYELAMYLKINHPPKGLFPKNGLTSFAQAMPDNYKKTQDPVLAYRIYYVSDAHKRNIATWRKRNRPNWYNNQIRII